MRRTFLWRPMAQDGGGQVVRIPNQKAALGEFGADESVALREVL